MILILCSVSALGATLLVDNQNLNCSDLLGNPFCTIQAALDNSTDGDLILVGNGTYVESITINNEVHVKGDGAFSTTIINGTGAQAVTINADNVVFEDFFVTIPTGTDPFETAGIVVRPDHNNVLVRSNHVHQIGTTSVITHAEGIFVGTNNTAIVLDNNTITEIGSILATGAVHGIFIYGFNESTQDVNITRNTIVDVFSSFSSYGISMNHYIVNVLIDSNSISNINAGGFAFGSVAWGTSLPVGVEAPRDITWSNNMISGVVGGVFGGSGLSPGDLANQITITSNIIMNTTAAVFIDALDDFSVTYNNISKNCGSVVVNSGTSVNANFNYFSQNSCPLIGLEGFVNLVNETVNAEQNDWGSCDGPSGAGPGTGDNVSANVTFDPWLGVCIHSKVNISCVFNDSMVKLLAKVNETSPLDSVNFVYSIDGNDYTAPGTVWGEWWEHVVPLDQLVAGMNLTWNVIAQDIFGAVFTNGNKTVYIAEHSTLGVSPPVPDGNYPWYLVNPTFTLTGDATAQNLFYRWDSQLAINYTGPFSTEGAPNDQNITGGIMDLHYFADFGMNCTEEAPEEIFYIDLQNPVVKPIWPKNWSIVYNNLNPVIEVLLDEIYQSNSGINESTVFVLFDNNSVPFNVTEQGIDAHLLIPTSNLTEGLYSVYVEVTDEAGRRGNLTWHFMINETDMFTMNVTSPEDGLLGERRVPFDITLSKEVELLEYRNLNDSRPKWRRLCKNCDGTPRVKNYRLNEGDNTLQFRATDFGLVTYEQVEIFVDSKKPKIFKTLPKRNSVFNGTNFYIKFTEENLVGVTLFYNNTVAFSCDSGTKVECEQYIDLGPYHGQSIEYFFEVEDVIRTVTSRKVTFTVDAVKPDITINGPRDDVTYGPSGVPFNISVSEEVKLEFADLNASNVRWRRLCSRCEDYGVDRIRKKRLSVGSHTLLFRAIDKAGNTDIESVIISVEP